MKAVLSIIFMGAAISAVAAGVYNNFLSDSQKEVRAKRALEVKATQNHLLALR